MQFQILLITLTIFLSACQKDDRIWKKVTFADKIFRQVFWVKNQFIVMGSDSDKILVYLTSSDGINWLAKKTNLTAEYLKYLNNQFIHITYQGGYLPDAPICTIKTTYDLISWQTTFSEKKIYPTSIMYDGEKYIANVVKWNNNDHALVENCGEIYVSTDLSNWFLKKLANSNFCIGSLFFAKGKYFATGYSRDQSGNDRVYSSTDTLNWKELTIFRGMVISNMHFENNELIFTGYGGAIYTSMDGENWINHSLPFGSNFTTVVRGQNDYLFLTDNGTEILTTRDFFSWKQFTYGQNGGTYNISGYYNRISAAATNGSTYVVVGDNFEMDPNTHYDRHYGIILTSQ